MAQLPHRTIEMLPSVYSCRGFFLWVEISLPVSLVLSQFGVRFLPAAVAKRQRSAGYPAFRVEVRVTHRNPRSGPGVVNERVQYGSQEPGCKRSRHEALRVSCASEVLLAKGRGKQGSLRFADALLRRRGTSY